MNACWCSSRAFETFSPDYGRCSECGTLVFQGEITELLGPDLAGFYGDGYWQDRQAELNHPPVRTRARQDLFDRNPYWLRRILEYLIPPASVLEVGCGHGSFVALLGAAGFQAQGVDLSPWIVDFARSTFGVPVRQGRIEDQGYEPGSFDGIVWMDVLEHLPDPVETLQYSASLLKPDGILVFQTPIYPGGSLAEMEASGSLFPRMLLPVEHLHLFSEDSVRRLLNSVGFNAVRFHLAVFPYDMFLVAGRETLPAPGVDSAESALQESPSGRLVLALLDLFQQNQHLEAHLADAAEALAAHAGRVQELTVRLQQLANSQHPEEGDDDQNQD